MMIQWDVLHQHNFQTNLKNVVNQLFCFLIGKHKEEKKKTKQRSKFIMLKWCHSLSIPGDPISLSHFYISKISKRLTANGNLH